MPARIVRSAPAKVNLALHVTGRRADGYHLLDSVVVFAGHGDTVTVSAASTDEFRITGRYGDGLAADAGNLVIRARDLLRRLRPHDTAAPVAILLDKALPIASGIGGGSADAAATLHALKDFWSLDINARELARAALSLGADLPMCLASRPLIARGVGEVLEPVAGLPMLPLVLINPGVAVSTPKVFAALESRYNPALPPLAEHGSVAGIAQWLAGTRNDLQQPATRIAPEIAETLAALDGAGALVARMSGSGATCYGLFTDAASTAAAAREITEHQPDWFVLDTYSAPSREHHG